MRAAGRVIMLVGALGAGCGGTGARRLCPEGTELAQERSTPFPSVWCKARDGVTTHWLEMQADRKTRRASCLYRTAKVEGTFTAWHPGGGVWVQGRYEAGEKTGRWTQWDKDARKVAEGEYRSGDLVQGAPVGMVAQCEKQSPP